MITTYVSFSDSKFFYLVLKTSFYRLLLLLSLPLSSSLTYKKSRQRTTPILWHVHYPTGKTPTRRLSDTEEKTYGRDWTTECSSFRRRCPIQQGTTPGPPFLDSLSVTLCLRETGSPCLGRQVLLVLGWLLVCSPVPSSRKGVDSYVFSCVGVGV